MSKQEISFCYCLEYNCKKDHTWYRHPQSPENINNEQQHFENHKLVKEKRDNLASPEKNRHECEKEVRGRNVDKKRFKLIRYPKKEGNGEDSQQQQKVNKVQEKKENKEINNKDIEKEKDIYSGDEEVKKHDQSENKKEIEIENKPRPISIRKESHHFQDDLDEIIDVKKSEKSEKKENLQQQQLFQDIKQKEDEIRKLLKQKEKFDINDIDLQLEQNIAIQKESEKLLNLYHAQQDIFNERDEKHQQQQHQQHQQQQSSQGEDKRHEELHLAHKDRGGNYRWFKVTEDTGYKEMVKKEREDHELNEKKDR